jgi:hypothetical protein
MGLFDNLKSAAGEFVSDAKDELIDNAKDKVTEATGIDKVTGAVEDVSTASESVQGAFGSLRDELSGS